MNATQWVGFCAFACAAAACFSAGRWPWRVAGLLFAASGAECALGWRFLAKSRITEAIGPAYAIRYGWQIAFLALAAGALALAIWAGWRCLQLGYRGRGLSITVFSLSLLATVFIIEIISLHSVDAVLYRPVGGIRMIGWLWLATAMLAVAGAVVARQEG